MYLFGSLSCKTQIYSEQIKSFTLQQEYWLVMKQQACIICTSEDPEVRVILSRLRSRLIRQSQEYVPNYQEDDSPRDNSDGFTRLFQLVFGSTTTSHSSILNCSHDKYSKYFRRKLKCDNVTFNMLCSQIAQKIAERNYQFEILRIQVGSCVKTAIGEGSNPLAERVAQRVEKEKEERNERRKDVPTTSRLIEPPVTYPLPFGRMPGFWMGQQPYTHYPWMFPGRPDSN